MWWYFVNCVNSYSIWSEIPGKFWNVVLEKDGEDQLDRSCEKWSILHEIRKRKANWFGHILRRNCLLKQFIEGKIKGEMEVARRRGRRCKKLVDDLKDRRGYSHLKEEALDRTMWRHRFGGGFGPVVRQNTEWMNCPGIERWLWMINWEQICKKLANKIFKEGLICRRPSVSSVTTASETSLGYNTDTMYLY